MSALRHLLMSRQWHPPRQNRCILLRLVSSRMARQTRLLKLNVLVLPSPPLQVVQIPVVSVFPALCVGACRVLLGSMSRLP